MRIPLFFLLCCVCLSARQPNIILIVSDDHGYADMSLMGTESDVETPHLDRLAAEGVRFTSAYATSPICTPSRIGILLGRYQQRYDNWWYSGPGLPGEEIPTIAEVLGGAGYATCMIGKTHFNSNFAIDRRNHPLNHGFDRFYGFNGPAKHYLIHNASAERVFMADLLEFAPQQRGYPLMFLGPMWINKEQHDQEGFSTELFRDEAIDFIDARRQKPFFIMLSFNAVHDQTYQLPHDYLRKNGIPIPDDWDPSVETSREWSSRTFSRELNRAYMIGHIQYLDEAVGRIVEHLDRTGLRNDTLILYTVDNGGSTLTAAHNTPLNGGKFTVFEGGLRTPLIVSWPGTIPQGLVMDNVVSHLDFLPTFAAAAETEPPAVYEGINLLPLLTGADPDLEHETLFWDLGQNNQFAVRHGDWKLRFSLPSERGSRIGERPGFYLHNLRTDIGETTNLADERPDKVAELTVLHRQWREEVLRNLP